MAAGIPEDVPPVAAHEAQAFQAFVIDGVTKQLQKDNKAERLPEFIRAAGAYGKGDLDADAFLLTLADLFGEQRSLKLLPSLARLVKNDDRRRSLLKAARGGAVEVLGADSPNGGAAAPAPPAAVSAHAPEPVAPAPPAELPAAVAAPPEPSAPAVEEPTPEPPAPEPSPPAPTEAPPTPEASAPEPPAQAPAEERPTVEEPPAPAPAPAAPVAAGDAKKKKKKKKKGRRRAGSAGSTDEPAPAPAPPTPEAADAGPEAPTPAAETPEEPSTPTPTVPADPALFTPRPATPEPTVPADPSLFTPVAFAAASREMIEELTAPDIIPQSNVLPTDAVAGAQAAADERAKAGYDADGNQGGPYTEDKPPPGFVFSAYRKGCTGIVWKAAESTTAAAPAEPQATEPESAAAGEAEWERQLAALEAEKKAQQAAAEEAKAPENPPEKRRAVAAFTAAENWQMSVNEGAIVEATKDHEDGWTECRLNDKSGAVPTTYLEKVVEAPPSPASTLATGNEAAELQRDAVRRVRTRLDQLNRSERLPELVQGTRRYAAGDLTASGMRSALADLLSSDEEARIVCRTLARLVVDDTKRAALAAAAEAPAIENEDFFAAVARDTAELRQQKSEEEDRRVSSSSAAEDEREILLARSHGVGVSPDVVTRLQRLQEDEELAKRLQREEERRKSNSYAELSRQRTDAALAERLARTPAPEPPKEQSFWGSLFGEDDEPAAPPHSPETDRKVQEDADAALARRLQAEEHARAARRRAPAVYDTPTYSQPAVQYDQYGRPSQAPYRQPQPPPPPAYASEPSVDEYGRPVMSTQRAPSYAPPPRQDYEPQARRYVPPAPPPAPPPYAHSMRGSLGSAPYARPAAPAPAPPPPVVEEAGDLFSCGACGAQMQVRGAEPGAQFTCTECGAVNEI